MFYSSLLWSLSASFDSQYSAYRLFSRALEGQRCIKFISILVYNALYYELKISLLSHISIHFAHLFIFHFILFLISLLMFQSHSNIATGIIELRFSRRIANMLSTFLFGRLGHIMRPLTVWYTSRLWHDDYHCNAAQDATHIIFTICSIIDDRCASFLLLASRRFTASSPLSLHIYFSYTISIDGLIYIM